MHSDLSNFMLTTYFRFFILLSTNKYFLIFYGTNFVFLIFNSFHYVLIIRMQVYQIFILLYIICTLTVQLFVYFCIIFHYIHRYLINTNHDLPMYLHLFHIPTVSLLFTISPYLFMTNITTKKNVTQTKSKIYKRSNELDKISFILYKFLLSYNIPTNKFQTDVNPTHYTAIVYGILTYFREKIMLHLIYLSSYGL